MNTTFLTTFSYSIIQTVDIALLHGTSYNLYLCTYVPPNNDGMPSLVRLQSQLLSWLDALLLHLFNLACEYRRWINSRVDTARFDGNDDVTVIFEEMMRIEGNNTSLVWLSNISKYDIDHWHEHSVFLWMTGVFNDG